MRDHFSFTIKRPFDYVCKLDTYPVRVVIVRDSFEVAARFRLSSGAKASEPLRGYWCHLSRYTARLMARGPVLRNMIRGEICLSAMAFCPELIAHEAIHCLHDAKRDGALIHHAEGWEESIAHGVESLVGIIWRRAQHRARKIRWGGRVP